MGRKAADKPDKCEVLRMTLKCQNRTSSRQHIWSMDSHWSLYLGLTIGTKLNYNEHVSNVCKIANSTRAFIHCNTKNCPQRVKAMAFTTYVHPELKYASTVWCPHTAQNIGILKQYNDVQRGQSWMTGPDLTASNGNLSLCMSSLVRRQSMQNLVVLPFFLTITTFEHHGDAASSMTSCCSICSTRSSIVGNWQIRCLRNLS